MSSTLHFLPPTVSASVCASAVSPLLWTVFKHFLFWLHPSSFKNQVTVPSWGNPFPESPVRLSTYPGSPNLTSGFVVIIADSPHLSVCLSPQALGPNGRFLTTKTVTGSSLSHTSAAPGGLSGNVFCLEMYLKLWLGWWITNPFCRSNFSLMLL